MLNTTSHPRVWHLTRPYLINHNHKYWPVFEQATQVHFTPMPKNPGNKLLLLLYSEPSIPSRIPNLLPAYWVIGDVYIIITFDWRLTYLSLPLAETFFYVHRRLYQLLVYSRIEISKRFTAAAVAFIQKFNIKWDQ